MLQTRLQGIGVKKVKDNFSAKAKDYDRYAVVQRKVLKELQKRVNLVNFQPPILDVGVGTGSELKGWKEVVGVDISYEMCRLAKGNVRWVVNGRGEFLPFKNESFYIILSSFSLQWMDLEKALKEMERVLKRGGFVFIALPVEGSLKELFNCWQKAFIETKGEKDILFEFKRKEEIYRTFKKYFDVLEVGEKEYKLFPRSVKEAVKLVTGIGAKNPHRPPRPLKSTVKRFTELFSKNCVITYKVLFITARKT